MSDKSIKRENKLALINAIHYHKCLWNPIDKAYRNNVIQTCMEPDRRIVKYKWLIFLYLI